MKRRDILKLLSGLALPYGATLQVGRSHAAEQKSSGTGSLQLGMNVAPVTYWSTEHPFNNLALSASRWRLQEIDGPFSWDLPLPPMTPDLYPLNVPTGSFLESFLIFTPHRAHLPELLTVTYEGTGKIEYLAGGELVKRQPGVDTIRISHNEYPVIARLMSTSETDPIRNLHLAEKQPPASGTFRPDFLKRLSRMSVLRFMDWMDTNNSKITQWDQRPLANRYSQTEGGVALELMVELCNTLSIAPWFTVPHLANDDYVRKFAELVRDTLDPSLPVYVEYSNEVWNGLFQQSQHAQREGARLALSSNQFEAGFRYYADRATNVISICEQVFGSSSERILGVYGAQAVTPWTSEVILSWKNVAEHADVLAVAPYFGGGLGGPEKAPDVARWSLDQLFDALAAEIEGHNREMIAAQAAMAERFGVRLVAYEGGQHLVGHSGTPHDQKLHQLFAEANRDSRMGDLYRNHLAHWAKAGGSTYALFNSMGSFSQWGSWGLLENESQKTAPKWQAVQDMLGA